MKDCSDKCWFENWFNSPYYHILYKNRNDKEAEFFIDNIVQLIQPSPNYLFLDLGCGKGRHAIHLHKKGFDVTGIDLSTHNIAFANQELKKQLLNPEKIRFEVKDMRNIDCKASFDVILNLFTSFGYFDNAEDDYITIKAVAEALKPEGKLIVDFMNAHKVLSNLVQHEVKIIDNIEFEINKWLDNQFVIKEIKFNDKGKEYCFYEKVKALTLADFEKYFAASNLKIVDLRGNYNLDSFDLHKSPRLIMVVQK
ncbi:MAG: class I SAM-dependent methyltransferase [Bacteroidia bacterium]